MPKFEYQVADRTGHSRKGVVEAADANEATRRLRREGNYVLSVQPTSHRETDEEAPLIPRWITRLEILYLTNELAVMVGTGITLSVALGSIAEQADNPSLARVVRDLKSTVESGQDFSVALARYPKLFDKTYVQLVRASEASGSLGEMLERIVELGRRQLESRNKVRAALVYPAIMLLASIGASVFLLVYVLPKFIPLFAGRGLALPVPTRLMMALSDFIVHRWYLVLAAGTALISGGTALFRTGAGRRIADNAKLSVPILGPMFRKATISRSLRTLATMLSSGVPMMQALRLCAEVSGNVHYEQEWHTVAEGVAEGQQIHEILANSTRFPKTLTQLISAGEKSGRLGPVLTRVSDYYDRELETAIKAATSIIEPLMVCFMGVVVGAVALALLLPIFTLSRTVG